MFHSWQASANPTDPHPQSRNGPKSRRQSSTTHACEECRRRKIRCDGKQPCSHCEWYKHPALCRYSKKQPRVVPSQRLLDELSGSLQKAQKVLSQLFPNEDLARLGELPRDELVGMIQTAGGGGAPGGPEARSPTSSASASASTSSPPVKNESPLSPFVLPHAPRSLSADGSATLDELEPEPCPDAYWDEAEKFEKGVRAVDDDVNQLSFSVKGKGGTSYLGVSSIAAALRVMSKINKALGQAILGNEVDSKADDDLESPTLSDPQQTAPSSEPHVEVARPTLEQPVLIDAYFDHVHPLIPMVDEARFRRTFAEGHRRDKAWLALLYMVLAMGTIAAATAADNSHLRYYHAARELMRLDFLGQGRVEALQALGLMGGLYLHYESLPNMANAVLGAAMRMACALGLHREYGELADQRATEGRPDFVRRAALIPREVRRRTWWSLFCLDTWATTTQGRPSLGRTGPAVTVLPPAFLADPPDPMRPLTITADDALVLVLRYETAFCRIATRIQDRLAESPLLPLDETVRFDDELKAWRAQLPAMFAHDQACPKRAQLPRAVMSWRYHNLRLVLHRPILLNHALRSSLATADAVSREEARLVAVCRSIATDCIDDIRLRWTRTQMSGWNGVWMLFQACMVPMVSAFAEFNRRDFAEVRAAQGQLESALELLAEMADWSVTAAKTLAFVRKMYDKSCGMMAQAEDQERRSQDELQGRAGGPPRPLADVFYGEAGSSHAGLFTPHGFLNGPEVEASCSHAEMLSSSTHPLQTFSHQAAFSHQPAFLSPLSEQMDYQGQHMQPYFQPHAPPDPGYYGMDQTDYMSQEEFQSFWQQVLWGEADLPDSMMDTTANAQYPAEAQGSAVPDHRYHSGYDT